MDSDLAAAVLARWQFGELDSARNSIVEWQNSRLQEAVVVVEVWAGMDFWMEFLFEEQ